eukprot:m.240988 g.240988  ORF g.240988 m.240988 type:complete len:610 (+) comp15316_c2_seq10:67-1896(+)
MSATLHQLSEHLASFEEELQHVLENVQCQTDRIRVLTYEYQRLMDGKNWEFDPLLHTRLETASDDSDNSNEAEAAVDSALDAAQEAIANALATRDQKSSSDRQHLGRPTSDAPGQSGRSNGGSASSRSTHLKSTYGKSAGGSAQQASIRTRGVGERTTSTSATTYQHKKLMQQQIRQRSSAASATATASRRTTSASVSASTRSSATATRLTSSTKSATGRSAKPSGKPDASSSTSARSAGGKKSTRPKERRTTSTQSNARRYQRQASDPSSKPPPLADYELRPATELATGLAEEAAVEKASDAQVNASYRAHKSAHATRKGSTTLSAAQRRKPSPYSVPANATKPSRARKPKWRFDFETEGHMLEFPFSISAQLSDIEALVKEINAVSEPEEERSAFLSRVDSVKSTSLSDTSASAPDLPSLLKADLAPSLSSVPQASWLEPTKKQVDAFLAQFPPVAKGTSAPFFSGASTNPLLDQHPFWWLGEPKTDTEAQIYRSNRSISASKCTVAASAAVRSTPTEKRLNDSSILQRSLMSKRVLGTLTSITAELQDISDIANTLHSSASSSQMCTKVQKICAHLYRSVLVLLTDQSLGLSPTVSFVAMDRGEHS